MYVSKTYSLSTETVELIASLAKEYGSQRRVIEIAVFGLVGEPLSEKPAKVIAPRPVATAHPAINERRLSFAEQKRRSKVADAVAAKTCPDCGDRLPWCGCEDQAADVREACRMAGLSPRE